MFYFAPVSTECLSTMSSGHVSCQFECNSDIVVADIFEWAIISVSLVLQQLRQHIYSYALWNLFSMRLFPISLLSGCFSSCISQFNLSLFVTTLSPSSQVIFLWANILVIYNMLECWIRVSHNLSISELLLNEFNTAGVLFLFSSVVGYSLVIAHHTLHCC